MALASDRDTGNGQPAVAAYTWREDEDCYRPFALDVLSSTATASAR